MSPTLTTEQLVAQSEAIASTLTAHGSEAETLRRLPDASVAAMADAGLWRILTPRTFGGWEAGLRAQVETLLVTAAAESAAGWVQMVINAHAWIVGSFSVECQEEVWAGGPNTRFPGTLASQGRARRVDGGWVVNGRWQFASGVAHGDWLIMGSVVVNHSKGMPRGVHVVVPKADVMVDDTWFTIGLRGTGSCDLVATEMFVPDYRAMPTGELFEGLSPHGERHATHFNRLPVNVCLCTQLAAAVVGIATGGLDLHIEGTSTRAETYFGTPKRERVGAQTRIAESAAELDAARMFVRAAADRCDVVAATGIRLTTDERAQLKWHVTYATELARRATDRWYAGSGAHAVYNDSTAQARYRDVNTACHHAMADFDGSAEMYGRFRLGLDPRTPLI